MAQPLSYTPEARTAETARDDLDRLIETLHERGVLTALDGLTGALPDVLEVLLNRLDTPSGRNALSNLAVAGAALTALDPDRLAALRAGTEQSLTAARDGLQADPPGLVALFRQLNDPDVRRTLHALLLFLQAFGRHLHPGPASTVPAPTGNQEP